MGYRLETLAMVIESPAIASRDSSTDYECMLIAKGMRVSMHTRVTSYDTRARGHILCISIISPLPKLSVPSQREVGEAHLLAQSLVLNPLDQKCSLCYHPYDHLKLI